MTDSPHTEFGAALREIGMVVDLLRLSATEAVEEIAPLIHPQMQVVAAPGVAPTRPYETREHFLEYFSEARANGVLVQPDAFQVGFACSGAVVVAGSVRMRTRGGDAETPAWFVYTFRDGLIASLETHLSAEMAEQATGSPTLS